MPYSLLRERRRSPARWLRRTTRANRCVRFATQHWSGVVAGGHLFGHGSPGAQDALLPQVILTSHVIVLFVVNVLGLALLLLVGKLVYNLHFMGNVGLVLLAFVLSSLSFFALGFVLDGLAPTARTAQIVAMVLFYPMIFLSGSGIPREIMPESVRRISECLPLTHVVTLLRGLWLGDD